MDSNLKSYQFETCVRAVVSDDFSSFKVESAYFGDLILHCLPQVTALQSWVYYGP